MKGLKGFFSKFYMILCFLFFYLPILVTMVFSFNSSKSLTKFTGFSLRWYEELVHNNEVAVSYTHLDVYKRQDFLSSGHPSATWRVHPVHWQSFEAMTTMDLQFPALPGTGILWKGQLLLRDH